MASRTRRHNLETSQSSPRATRQSTRKAASFNRSATYRDTSATYNDSESDEDKEVSGLDEVDSGDVTREIDIVSDRSPIMRKRGDMSAKSPQLQSSYHRVSPRQKPRSPEGPSQSSPPKHSPYKHDTSGEFLSPVGRVEARRPVSREGRYQSDGGRFRADRSPQCDDESSLSGDSFMSSRTSTPVRKRPARDSDSDQINLIVVGAVVTVIVFILLQYFFSSPGSPNFGSQKAPLENEVVLKNFEAAFAQVKEIFPSQTKRFWATLAAATKRVMRENPIQPAVIILAAPQGAMETANCIAHKFVHAVSDAYKSSRPLEINVTSHYPHLTPKNAKLSLDEDLRQGLEGGSKAVGLYHLEALHPLAASLLHGYCDNENAPFKDVAMVFSLLMTDVTPDAVTGGDAMLEDFLQRVWGEVLDIDNLSALLSRVANNVAMVIAEESDIIRAAC